MPKLLLMIEATSRQRQRHSRGTTLQREKLKRYNGQLALLKDRRRIAHLPKIFFLQRRVAFLTL